MDLFLVFKIERKISARLRLFYVEGAFKYQSPHWSFLLVIWDENFDEAGRSGQWAAYASNVEYLTKVTLLC